MEKIYVIKNIVTKKYSAGAGQRWVKNIYDADTFNQSWIDDIEEAVSAGDKEMRLGRNERFVEVKLIEV